MRPVLTVDVSRAISQFPCLAIFATLTSDIIAEEIASMLRQGVSQSQVQAEVETDAFAISIAGAVFATLHNDDSFGCDARE